MKEVGHCEDPQVVKVTCQIQSKLYHNNIAPMVYFTIGAIWLSRSATNLSGRGVRFPKPVHSASLVIYSRVTRSHPAESPAVRSTFVFIFVVELLRHKHEFGVGFKAKLSGVLAQLLHLAGYSQGQHQVYPLPEQP